MLIATTQRLDFLDNLYKSYCNYTYINWLKDYPISLIIITDFKEIDKIVETCDMLLLSGGYHIHPSFYNEDKDTTYLNYHEEIDVLDFVLLKAFHKAHKPVLGICRGMQLINIYFKGTLFQKIENHNNHNHPIVLSTKGVLNQFYPKNYIANSFHQQAINKLGNHLRIEALSKDGIIEAISYEDYIIGIQWHPELLKDDPILLYFLENLISI